MEKDVIDRAMESGDPATAEEAFREIDIRLRSLTGARERADLMMRKAVLYEKLGRIDDARKQLASGLKEAPDDPDIRLQFDYIDGAMYHQEENFSEAFKRLTAVLSNHAERLAHKHFRITYEDIQQHRAFELFALGDYTNAIPLFEEALSFESIERDKSVALANLGNCYARLKKFEPARKRLEQAIQLGQLHNWEGQAHYDLALTYACLHLLEESNESWSYARRGRWSSICHWKTSISGFLVFAEGLGNNSSPSVTPGSRGLPEALTLGTIHL